MLTVIYTPVTFLEANAGVDVYSGAWLVTMIATFVACLGLSLIKNVTLRKAYSSGLGLFFGFYCNGFAYILVILSFCLVYLAVLLLPRR